MAINFDRLKEKLEWLAAAYMVDLKKHLINDAQLPSETVDAYADGVRTALVNLGLTITTDLNKLERGLTNDLAIQPDGTTDTRPADGTGETAPDGQRPADGGPH